MTANIITQLQEFREWFLAYEASNKNIYVIAFLILGALLVVLLTKKFQVPVVVGYVFLGILLSVDLIKSLPFLDTTTKEWYAFIIEDLNYIPHIALSFIAFTIGSELSINIIKKMGKSIIYIVILQAFAAFLLVTLGLYLFGLELYLALVFGAIASATAPAATVMVIQEYNAEGPVTSMIMAVVGIDDAIALILFSLVNPIAFFLYSEQGNLLLSESIITAFEDILGALILGAIIGYFSQKLLLYFEEKIKKIMILITTITGVTAISIFMGFSPLIANMTVGFAYRNLSRKNLGINEYLDTLTIPLYAMFFILAGTEIKFSSITSASFIFLAIIYTMTRLIGKIGGSSLAAHLAGASENIKKYVGLGLLPQSGVALALAYTIQKQYVADQKIGLLVFNIILFTSILTEIFGPLATKYAIFKSGEAKGQTKAE